MQFPVNVDIGYRDSRPIPWDPDIIKTSFNM